MNFFLLKIPWPKQQFHQVPVIQHNHPLAVHQMFSPSGDAYQYYPKNRDSARLDSSEVDEECWDGRQPLYANAPPKPRRLNSSKDRSDTPSPERLVYQVRGISMDYL